MFESNIFSTLIDSKHPQKQLAMCVADACASAWFCN